MRRIARQAVAVTLLGGLCASFGTFQARAQEVIECLLEASVEVNLGSPADGVIAQMFVERGDMVHKGQPLVRLNDSVEKATVALSHGRAEFARRKAARNEELYNKQLISIQERDQLETEARLAELELAEREAALRLRTIRSPIDGVVADRYAAPGDQVLRGSAKILRLLQLDPLHAEAVAPASLLGKIRVGSEADVTPLGGTGGPQRARVSAVDRMIDAASGTFRIRLQMRNPGLRIPAGLRCRVSFPTR